MSENSYDLVVPELPEQQFENEVENPVKHLGNVDVKTKEEKEEEDSDETAGKAGTHPYLKGNFAPVERVQPLSPCEFEGTIPQEFAGGQYVRNASNPIQNSNMGREYHWFDGDGMLSGVLFRRTAVGIQPEFVNKFVLTDLYLASTSTPSLKQAIPPSIATLTNPTSTIWTIVLSVFRTILIIILSNLPGSQQIIKRISVVNTNILFHDGRALATCESGPPMRVTLPELETVGWWNGIRADGEPAGHESEEYERKGYVHEHDELASRHGFGGGTPVLKYMKEWTTAHPKVDPVTKDFICYHSTFFEPFVFYSVIPSTWKKARCSTDDRLLNMPVQGMTGAKMMHDFGVSRYHTIILDLPLSLDPRQIARGKPVVNYDPFGRTRFGVFPRWQPEAVRWFETEPCCIFHTANSWDELETVNGEQITVAVHMLACRLNSPRVVFNAGNIRAPRPLHHNGPVEKEQCRLYYYRFDLLSNVITQQFALSHLPCEFPSLRESLSMVEARYVYACSLAGKNFGRALGAAKIDSLIKMDTTRLIAQGVAQPPTPITGCVDMRTADEIYNSDDATDPIQIFRMPPHCYTQECRFVAREDGTSEDDGWLIAYVFDESQLDENGDAGPDARSELWVIDAVSMRDVVAKVKLPMRVPYGLHGSWFSEEMLMNQRPLERVRTLEFDAVADNWMTAIRNWMIAQVA